MSEKEYTPKNILSLIAVGAIMVAGTGLITGCDESWTQRPLTPQEQLMEQPKFTPQTREFTLEDGTPCVMVWTPMATSRRAGSSGVSCDWDSE